MKFILLFMLSFFFTSETTIQLTEAPCKLSTSKVRSLVKTNWSNIQNEASFTISNKKDFEVKKYRTDGDDLVVDILSKGYWYDITFTVSFSAYFDASCAVTGNVLDVYNYKKK